MALSLAQAHYNPIIHIPDCAQTIPAGPRRSCLRCRRLRRGELVRESPKELRAAAVEHKKRNKRKNELLMELYIKKNECVGRLCGVCLCVLCCARIPK